MKVWHFESLDFWFVMFGEAGMSSVTDPNLIAWQTLWLGFSLMSFSLEAVNVYR